MFIALCVENWNPERSFRLASEILKKMLDLSFCFPIQINWLIANVTCWQEQQSDNFSLSLDYTSVMRRDGAWTSVLRASVAQIHCLSWTSSTVFCIKVIHQVSLHPQLVCVLTFLAALKYITSVSIHNQCNELIFPERVLLKFVRVLFKKTKQKVPHTRLQSERLDNLNLSENVI